MSVEQLEQQIERLPREELARLAGWLDRFLGRTIPEDPDRLCDLTDGEKAELLRRRDELMAHPELAQPMDGEYFTDLKRELADARTRKASGSFGGTPQQQGLPVHLGTAASGRLTTGPTRLTSRIIKTGKLAVEEMRGEEEEM
jgi:hypothetical protein